MREKLETLPLTELKAIAKHQGMKGISTMRKSDLIDLLCAKAKELEMEAQAAADGGQASSGTEGRAVPDMAGNSSYEEAAAQTADGSAPAAQESEQASAEHTRNPMRSASYRGDAARDNYRRNDGQNRQQRPGRPSYNNNRQPYGYGAAANRTDTRIATNVNRPAGTRPAAAAPSGTGTETARPAAAAGMGTAPARPAPQTAPGTDVPRYTQPQETVPAEPVIRVEGPRVSAASITPQIQAQFPDQTVQDIIELDSGIEANGILEVMPDGFGFIRCENFLPGENDVYVAPSQIRRFNLKTGDILVGSRRIKTASEKFAALLYVRSVNGYPPSVLETRPSFEKLTPIFPNERLHMETPGRPNSTAMRVLDLLAPIGKGQRGMIVSPPKAGKTTLLKQVAQAITTNHPDMHLIILLIDERPEEVTDIRESVVGKNVEVIYSTFDELPERHKRVSEMVVERARRLVEHGRDVIILLDSITRLARAYNIVVPPSGRTLSGGMDPAALHMPKRFFGAARNMREGGSLTILATALVNTGSRMDDVVYEEFKGTGNMELVLDRKLSEKRIFPAIDILKSGTRNDHLLLTREEQDAVEIIHKATNGLKAEESVERLLDQFAKTRTNRELIDYIRRMRFI